MTGFREEDKALMGSFMHELKTPLAIVRSHLESEITQGSLDTRLRRKLVLDVEELARLNNLINEMSLLLECNSICDVKDFQAHSLLELLVDVVELLEPMAGDNKQQLSLVADENIIINMQQEKFQQVLLNIVGNALKYTPKMGKISLLLSQDEQVIKIGIEDDGIGMDDVTQSQIFEPFYRGDNVRVNGVGLGLAISQAIVKQHFGEIVVRSSLGKGSLFCIVLPKEKVCL